MHVKLVLATVAAVVFMGESPLGLLDMVHANPLTSWRPSQTSSSHRDVEAVEPVRRGGSRSSLGPIGPLSPASSDEDDISVLLPIGFGSGIRGLGFGGRPLLPTRDSDEDSSEESGYGAGGYLHPFFIDPMTNFMAQMAEMVADMRRQMSQVLAGGTDISKLGNTTSTTKVVDGHIITVNETVVGGEDGVDLVHIRIIDVQPMESSMPTDANSGESGNKEGSKNGSEDDTQDGEKDAEALSSDEATGSPNRSENEIPIKVGSEVDDLNA